MSEAKDWAGELISGQTGTGRILVRLHFIILVHCGVGKTFIKSSHISPSENNNMAEN